MTIERIGPMDPVQSFKKTKPANKPAKSQGADSINLSEEAKSKAEVYSVDTPPPTVSGKMHLGHAFSYAQQDFVVRFQRMLGKNVFYPFGTDDNGIPTERLIEKTKKVKAFKMKRQEFIKLCLETLEIVDRSSERDRHFLKKPLNVDAF